MNKTDLDRIVNGAKKHARNQLRRERRTRFGLATTKRTMVGDDYDVSFIKDYRTDDDGSFGEFERNIVRGHLREWAKSESNYQFATAALLDNEDVQSLCAEMGMNYSTGRVKLHRARKFLEIPKKD